MSLDSSVRRRRKGDPAADRHAGGEGIPGSPDSGARRRKRERDPSADVESVLPGGAQSNTAFEGDGNADAAETRVEKCDSNGSDGSTADQSSGDASGGDASSGEVGARGPRGPDPARPTLPWSGSLDELSPPSGRRLRKAVSKCAPQEADGLRKPKSQSPCQPSLAKKSTSGSAGAGAGSGARGGRRGNGGSEGAEEGSPAARKKKKGVAVANRDNENAEAQAPRRRSGEESEGGAAAAGNKEGDSTKTPVEEEGEWRVAGNRKGKKPAAVRGEGGRGIPSREGCNDATKPPPSPSSVVGPAGGLATPPPDDSTGQGRDRSPSVEVLEEYSAVTSASWRVDSRGLFVGGDDGGGSVASRLKNKRKRTSWTTTPAPLEQDQGDGGGWPREEGSAAAGADEERFSPSASVSSEQDWAAAAEVSSGEDSSGSEDNENGDGDGHRAGESESLGGGGRCEHDGAEAPMAGLMEEQGMAKRLHTDVLVGPQGDSEVSREVWVVSV